MKAKLKRIVSVVGLGYVGLPVAVAFGKIRETIGFDINETRIKELGKGIDKTGEVSQKDLKTSNILFSNSIRDLKKANFHIVAVPTPVDTVHRPDLTPLLKASHTVGSALKKGDIVVFESTVYPGATEEECVPILEKASGLKCGKDFKVGYSPERINPGDKDHVFTKIKKVVSGQDKETLDIVAEVYGSVVEAGVHKASSIKVAEAAKVIENTQRDLNIALINELAIIFHAMNLDTNEVLDAAGTKWNFLKFKPGLVGGHCIGVDPYYLTHKAEELGYIPQVILSGRRINDGMGKYIVQQAVKEMIHSGHNILSSTATVLGISFKENCEDVRNSKVYDIVKELKDHGIQVQVSDPLADPKKTMHEYNIRLTPFKKLKPADVLILAVAHDEFKRLDIDQLMALCKKPNPVFVDIKGVFNQAALKKAGLRVWRL